MNFIEKIKERARQDIKTIVLPEAEDIRTLKATEVALKEKYANIILIGNEKEIKEKAKANNVNGSVTQYFVVYLQNTGGDQTGADSGKTVSGTVTVRASTGANIEAAF